MPETAKKAAAKPAPQAAADDTPTHESLAAALAAFQSDMPTVHKGQTARIPGRDGRAGYSYQYADLADVARVAHPLLARHGLSFTTSPQHLDGVGFVLRGVLRHTSGQEDTGVLPITGRSAQELGSSLTYLRRYLLGCMTGIVTDEDEDGTAAQTAGSQRPQAEAPEATQPQTPQHVVDLQERLGALDADGTAEVRAWWAGERLPFLQDLDQFQAQAVHSYLDEREKGGAPQDPQ